MIFRFGGSFFYKFFFWIYLFNNFVIVIDENLICVWCIGDFVSIGIFGFYCVYDLWGISKYVGFFGYYVCFKICVWEKI